VEFLAAVASRKPGLDRLIRAGYALPSNLATYFTVGPKENASLDHHPGATKAPQAAGVIHSDFERGFIRSETIGYDDYIAGGGRSRRGAMPASCGWKARITRSPTATCCISALRTVKSRHSGDASEASGPGIQSPGAAEYGFRVSRALRVAPE